MAAGDRSKSEYRGINYEAYLQALTEAGEPDHRTEWKIRLYDIAFLMEDPEELGRVVEIQPEEGLVDLQFTFKRETSSERARGEKEHVQVVHLPLAEPVKAQASTTAEAASFTAGDVEPGQPAVDRQHNRKPVYRRPDLCDLHHGGGGKELNPAGGQQLSISHGARDLRTGGEHDLPCGADFPGDGGAADL